MRTLGPSAFWISENNQVGEMPANYSLSPVTDTEWKEQADRVARLKAFIPLSAVHTTSLNELKELGGNAIVLTCPMSDTIPSLTEFDGISLCHPDHLVPVVTSTVIMYIGRTKVQEIIACPEFISEAKNGNGVQWARWIVKAFASVVFHHVAVPDALLLYPRAWT